MANRSPNYPTVDLGAALEAIRPVWKAELRSKMARQTLAKHMGYTSLNGRALSKIGALRAYGLIEGSGDELRVTDEARDALLAPEHLRKGALGALSVRPPLFRDILGDFPDGLPSEPNLIFWLVKRGFSEDAAGKAAQSYLNTMRLVGPSQDGYIPPDPKDADMDAQDQVTVGPPMRRVVPKPTGLHAETGALVRTAKFPLPEGDATLTFPALLSSESLELLRSFIDLTVRQMELAKKAAPILYPDQMPDDPN